jgi:hypothetical protein
VPAFGVTCNPVGVTASDTTTKLRVVPAEVAEQLGFYVYVLRDPRDHQVFYVGKGKGNRVYAHRAAATGKDPDDTAAVSTAKRQRILDIEQAGYEVEHLFVRTGLATDDEAFTAEQAVIDAYDATGVELTNLQGGHNSATHGLSTVEAAVARLAAPLAPSISQPVVVLIINRAWRPDMNPEEIYQATRGHWIVSLRTRQLVKYAFGVAYGLIRGVYRVDSWFASPQPDEEGKWGFAGTTDSEMTARFLGTSVRHLVTEHARNPVRLHREGFPEPDATPASSLLQPMQ